MQLAAIRGVDDEVRRSFRNAVVDDRFDFRAQRQHFRTVDAFVRVFMLAGAAVQQADGARMVDAELALEPSDRRLFAGQFQHQRMHLQRDLRNVGRFQIVFFTQLHAAVDAWVDDDAASEGLVRIERDFPAAAEVFGNFGPVGLVGKNLHQATWRFQCAT